jgi:hypothetical protein
MFKDKAEQSRLEERENRRRAQAERDRQRKINKANNNAADAQSVATAQTDVETKWEKIM